MTDNISLNKAAIIRRCLARVQEEYQEDPSRLDDFTIYDALVLNLLKACEASIDLAMHHVAKGRLGNKAAGTPSTCCIVNTASRWEAAMR